MRTQYKKFANRGFTLLECLIAIVLVGIAVAALVAANGSFTRVNAQASELSTAEYLIEQIRERSDLFSYEDVYSFDDAAFNPPITADGQVLNDFGAYTQRVTVENINPSNFELVVVDHSTNYVRVSVTILLNGKKVTTSRWIRARYP
ncbi:MAG: type II secretion system protein [Phycisphaerae bacterium]|jgi:prepilin-type N-terminal cleavage/methylation domain-containing protein